MDNVRHKLSLAVKLSELFSGAAVSGGVTVRGDGGEIPIEKRDGVFVFSEKCPRRVAVRSKQYTDVTAPVCGAYMRLHLVKRQRLWPRGVTCCRLLIKPREEAHLYLAGGREYELCESLCEGEERLSLYKTDFYDITGQYHAPVYRGGSIGEPFFISAQVTSGVYRLLEASKTALERFECVIAPLYTLIASDTGELVFPMPDEKSRELAVFRDSGTTRLSLAAGTMNEFKMEE